MIKVFGRRISGKGRCGPRHGDKIVKVTLVRRETEKAFQVMIGEARDAKPFIWLPKSHVINADDIKAGDKNCEVIVTEWIASQKSLL